MLSKKKLYIMSTIIASCVLSLSLGKLSADCKDGRCSAPNSSNNGASAHTRGPTDWRYYNNQRVQDDSQSMNMNNGTDWRDFNQPVPAPGQRVNGKGTFYDENGQELKALRGHSVDKIKGVIKTVNRMQYPNGVHLQLVVTTDDGKDVKIMLGPAKYIEQQRIKLMTGDKVVVTVFPMTANGEKMFIGKEVNKNGAILMLRDDNRNPVWKN